VENRAGGVAQGEGPEFKPQYRKKKKKKKNIKWKTFNMPSQYSSIQKLTK
jgi:hypothetical protein